LTLARAAWLAEKVDHERQGRTIAQLGAAVAALD
jgi:hypothetical protein